MKTTIKQELYAAETASIFVDLIEISHDSWSAPLRFCNNTEQVISKGSSYDARAFDISPGDVQASDATGSLTIDDVEQTLSWSFQLLDGRVPALVRLSYVTLSEPDEIIDGPYEYQITNVQTVTAEGRLVLSLSRKGLLSYYLSTDSYSNALFPGLYG